MNILIIGYGEIGKSIHELYPKNNHKYQVYYYDAKPGDYRIPMNSVKIDVLHLCYTYNENFTETATQYIKKHKPALVIIHSTVTPGTTKKIYDATKTNIAHSPCMGKHPHLAESMRVFTKIIGGINNSSAKKAQAHLQELGVKSMIYPDAHHSEIAKLLDTTYYGVVIMYMKDVYRHCEEKGYDFDFVYTATNKIYNAGYSQLGETQFIRPILKYNGRGVGGHCVFENAVLLNEMNAVVAPARNIISEGKPKVKK